MRKKVLILGVSGMLGHACFDYFDNLDEFEVYGTWRNPTKGRIKNFDVLQHSVGAIISEIEPDWIINCIGVIKQKIDENSPEEVKKTVRVNQLFPLEIAEAISGFGTRVIQIGTDCVFNGVEGSYTEKSPHNAYDLYGKSKSQGEVISPEFLNLRVSIIGIEVASSYSLVSWFLARDVGAEINGFTNHLWNGISSRTLSKIVAGIIRSEKFVSGTYHVIPEDRVSKYELLCILARYFDREDIRVIPFKTPMAVDRTLSTIYPDFNRTIWQSAGYKEIPTIEEIINELAKQD